MEIEMVEFFKASYRGNMTLKGPPPGLTFELVNVDLLLRAERGQVLGCGKNGETKASVRNKVIIWRKRHEYRPEINFMIYVMGYVGNMGFLPRMHLRPQTLKQTALKFYFICSTLPSMVYSPPTAPSDCFLQLSSSPPSLHSPRRSVSCSVQ